MIDDDEKIDEQNLKVDFQIGAPVLLDLYQIKLVAAIRGINLSPHKLTYDLKVWLSGDSLHTLDMDNIKPNVLSPFKEGSWCTWFKDKI